MGDGWRRFFPTAYLPRLADIAEWAGQGLDRLGESPLDTSGPHRPLTVRLLHLPTWGPASSVRIEPCEESWWLRGRELDGDAGFDLGSLARGVDRPLTDEECERIAGLWEYLRFWSRPVMSQGEDLFDGSSFLIEAVDGGRYHAACVDDPEWGDTFGEISFLFLRLAGFLPAK
jgi:hypothetical protein